MSSTVIWTKAERANSFPRIQITDTVIATVRAIGKGHITAAHVASAINGQLNVGDADQALTEQQVNNALKQIARLRYLNLSAHGHGAYLWS